MLRLHRRFPRPVLDALLAAAVLVLVGLSPLSAHAQIDKNGVPKDNIQAPPLVPRQPVQAPAALPGAGAAPDSVAPQRSTATDMAPNDALFDAINRGDISAVRDAVGRGADLNGRNVLGLTPLDLSVDLWRNNITFYLLSVRDAAPSVLAENKAATKEASAKSSAALVAKAKPVAAPARSVAVRAASAQNVAAPVGRDYVSADPGTPAPQVGFLGFGQPPK